MLTALHDGSATISQEQDEPRPPSGMSRSLLLPVAAAVSLLVVLALFLALRPSSQSGGADVTREHARESDIEHHFNRSYTGRVWFRVIPTAAHAGQDHRVRLRWGPNENIFTIRRLTPPSGTLLLDKNRPDDITFLVRVDPPARVDFGEGQPPAGAQNIPTRWTKRPPS